MPPQLRKTKQMLGSWTTQKILTSVQFLLIEFFQMIIGQWAIESIVLLALSEKSCACLGY